ncbi:MAG: DNA gyrase/topoisomerase IV subunit A, partial [Chlorobi bacterium]|nr:DNA gyrase/topoisomerase IV subunit A [Chlorobiota bacterium]
KKGGKIIIRAKIDIEDSRTLVIREIPFKTTTGSLIDSIIKANDNGKIKIKKILDNTAENVEIRIQLPTGVSPDKTIDALYAFTKCEISVSPQAVVIHDDKPAFMGVSEILEYSTLHTKDLLRRELEIQLEELRDKWHAANLERIFIEKRIYLDIQDQTTWEGVLDAIDKGLEPHIRHLKRPVTRDDLIRLTEIKIKRISKYDLNKARKNIEDIEAQIAEKEHHLANLTQYAIDYFKNIKKKYGKGRDRRTEIRSFENIEATKVVVRNVKLYVDRKEGFVGTSLRKNEYVADVSDIDDLIIFRADGKMIVTKVAPKTFVGKDIIHVGVFKKKDKRTVYNMIYRDGKKGPVYKKRFHVTGVTRDKEYDLTTGAKGSKVLYFSANPNGEAETVTVYLRPVGRSRKTKFDVDFSELAIKSRNARGNLVTKLPVKSVKLKEKGVSTLAPRKLWYDPVVNRLNTEERGQYLGEFAGDDKMFYVTTDGQLEVFVPQLEKHFPDKLEYIYKVEPGKPLTVIYYDRRDKQYYLKRFVPATVSKREQIIPEGTVLKMLSYDWRPTVEIRYKEDGKEPQTIAADEFISVKSHRAKGKKLHRKPVAKILFGEPLPYEPPAPEPETQDNKHSTEEPATQTPPSPDKDDDDTDGPTELTLF